jgi:hypothetical protein
MIRQSAIRLWRALLPRQFDPVWYLAAKAYRASDGRISSGPFKGMRYINPNYSTTSLGSEYTPKVLGIYERELYPLVERLCERPWDRIINIGAGEGYFAVGLALRCPRAAVTAFELNDRVANLLVDLSRENGVQERVRCKGKCENLDLAECLAHGSGRCLIVCDVEGYEHELLDPSRVPELRRTWVLVEVHEFAVAGVEHALRMRFSDSHTIEQIWAEERDAREYPYSDTLIRAFPASFLRRAVSERRPPGQFWLYLEPRSSNVA